MDRSDRGSASLSRGRTSPPNRRSGDSGRRRARPSVVQQAVVDGDRVGPRRGEPFEGGLEGSLGVRVMGARIPTRGELDDVRLGNVVGTGLDLFTDFDVFEIAHTVRLAA